MNNRVPDQAWQWLREMYQLLGWGDPGSADELSPVDQGTAILQLMGKIDDPPNAYPDDLAELNSLRNAIRALVNKGDASADDIRQAKTKLDELMRAAVAAGKSAEERPERDRKETIKAKLNELPGDPPDATPKDLQRLAGLRTQLSDLLSGGVPDGERNTAAETVVHDIRELIDSVGKAKEDDRAIRNVLTTELTDPSDAAPELLGPLAEARNLVTQALGSDGRFSAERIEQANEQLLQLRAARQRVVEEVRQATELAQHIQRKLTEEFTDPEGASEGEKEALLKAREVVTTALVGDGRFSLARSKAAEEWLKVVAARHEEAQAGVVARRDREQLLLALKNVLGPEQANLAQKEQLTLARTAVTDAVLDPVDAGKVVAGQQKLKELVTLVQKVMEDLKTWGEARDQWLLSSKNYATDPDGADGEQKSRLAHARQTLENALKLELSAESVVTVGNAVKALREAHELVAAEIKKDQDELTQQFEGVDGADKLAELVKGLSAKEVKQLVAEMGGAKALGAMAKTFPPAELKQLVADLGGGKASAGVLADVCGGDAAKLKTTLAELGGAKAVGDLLKGPLAGKSKLLGGLLAHGGGGDPKRLKKILDGFGGNLKPLTDLVANGGFTATVEEPPNSKKHVDAVEPDALGKLFAAVVTGDDTAGKAKDLCNAFAGQKVGALKMVLLDGGLGKRPDALAEILKTGCEADIDKFQKLTAGLNDKDILTKLKTLTTDKDGLGGRPEVLGHLIKETGTDKAAALFKGLDTNAVTQLDGLVRKGGFGELEEAGPPRKYKVPPDCLGKILKGGCANEPAKFKQFLGAFTTDEHRQDFKGLLVDGGLGGKPDCLNKAMLVGFGGDTNLGNGATKLRNLAGKLKDPTGTLGKVKSLLNQKDTSNNPYGLGSEPDVLGHLLKTGCDQDVDKVKAVFTTFDTEGLGKLNTLVADGGFGKPKPTGSRAVKPECLGELMKIGCDGSPGDLQSLVKGLSDNDRAGLNGVMRAGELGDEPKVLGHMYKLGCNKTPAQLHDFCTGFQTTGDQAKFKNLLKAGGFDGKGSGPQRPQTLGEVMKEGFKDRGKDPATQLKKLNDAFKPNGGTDTTANLKTMVDSFNFAGTTHGLNGKPGRRFKNLMKAFNDNVSKLPDPFYKSLNGQFPPNTPQPKNSSKSHAPFLTKAELIINAATFELGTPVPGLALNAIAKVDGVSSAHILKRHTRKYQSLGHPEINNNWNKHKDTTLYAEDTTEVMIAGYINEAQLLAGGTRNNALNIIQGYARKPNCATTGGTSTIGYDYLPPVPPPPPPGKPARLRITQFYPQSSGNKVTVNHSDMVAIKKALGK